MSLAVSAAVISSELRYKLDSPPLPLNTDTMYGDEHVVVTLGGGFGESWAVALTSEDVAVVTRIEGGELVGEPTKIELGDVECDPSSVIAKIEAGGKMRSIQMLGEDVEGALTLQMHGKVVDCVVRSVQVSHTHTWIYVSVNNWLVHNGNPMGTQCCPPGGFDQRAPVSSLSLFPSASNISRLALRCRSSSLRST